MVWGGMAVVVIAMAAMGKTSWSAAGLFVLGAALGTFFYLTGPNPVASWACVLPLWLVAGVLDSKWRKQKKSEEESQTRP